MYTYFVYFTYLAYIFLVEFVNSQVLLHGTDTKGAIIVTSANAAILKRLHIPICVATDVVTKLNKVTWFGKFRNLQVQLSDVYVLIMCATLQNVYLFFLHLFIRLFGFSLREISTFVIFTCVKAKISTLNI